MIKFDFKTQPDYKFRWSITFLGIRISCWRDSPKQAGCFNLIVGNYTYCVSI